MESSHFQKQLFKDCIPKAEFSSLIFHSEVEFPFLSCLDVISGLALLCALVLMYVSRLVSTTLSLLSFLQNQAPPCSSQKLHFLFLHLGSDHSANLLSFSSLLIESQPSSRPCEVLPPP